MQTLSPSVGARVQLSRRQVSTAPSPRPNHACLVPSAPSVSNGRRPPAMPSRLPPASTEQPHRRPTGSGWAAGPRLHTHSRAFRGACRQRRRGLSTAHAVVQPGGLHEARTSAGSRAPRRVLSCAPHRAPLRVVHPMSTRPNKNRPIMVKDQQGSAVLPALNPPDPGHSWFRPQRRWQEWQRGGHGMV